MDPTLYHACQNMVGVMIVVALIGIVIAIILGLGFMGLALVTKVQDMMDKRREIPQNRQVNGLAVRVGRYVPNRVNLPPV